MSMASTSNVNYSAELDNGNIAISNVSETQFSNNIPQPLKRKQIAITNYIPK